MTKFGILSFAHMHAYSYAACLNELPDLELTVIWDDDKPIFVIGNLEIDESRDDPRLDAPEKHDDASSD